MKFIISESQLKLMKESIEISEIKLPDFIENSIEQYKTSLGQHPSFPPENENKFETIILKKRYYELITNVKKVLGNDGDISKKTLISKLQELINNCKELEEPIKNELENICIDTVLQIFNLTHDVINFNCQLKNDIKSVTPLIPEKIEEEFSDIEHIEYLNNEILKRRLIDSLIMGASVRLSENFNASLSKIFLLNHKLPEIYHEIITINEYLTFVKEQKPSTDNIGGEVSVNLISEIPTINSEAIIFPILLFETIKGVMELICSHGLPKNKFDAEYVIGKSDFLLAYNWDKRIGVGLWDIIQEIIGDENLNLMPKIILELIQRKSNEFNYTMKEIFAKTKKGKQIVNNIIDEIKLGTEFENIENDITYNNNEEYFSPEELII